MFLRGLLLQIMGMDIYFFWLKISLAFLHLSVQLCVKFNCKFSKQPSTTPSVYSIHSLVTAVYVVAFPHCSQGLRAA